MIERYLRSIEIQSDESKSSNLPLCLLIGPDRPFFVFLAFHWLIQLMVESRRQLDFDFAVHTLYSFVRDKKMIKDIKSAAQKKRKGDNMSMPIDRKSGTRKYDRKVANKRFIWPDTMHRLFVASIFDGKLENERIK